MKKLVVIIVVLLTALYVQAQSPRVEVMLTRTYAVQSAKKSKLKSTQVKTDSLERAILKQVEKARREAIKKEIEKKRKAQIRKQWLKAIFLNGKFPGESDEAYRQRLQIQSYPASQPFK